MAPLCDPRKNSTNQWNGSVFSAIGIESAITVLIKAIQKLAAGTGLLDYDYYLGLLDKVGFDGPLVLHGLKEDQVSFCRNFLTEKLKDGRVL